MSPGELEEWIMLSLESGIFRDFVYFMFLYLFISVL